MRISDYYYKQNWYSVSPHKKVYPVVMVDEDMTEPHRDSTPKGKRACRAYHAGAQKIPEKILTSVRRESGVGVFLSVWV